jgi:hypothetical protein
MSVTPGSPGGASGASGAPTRDQVRPPFSLFSTAVQVDVPQGTDPSTHPWCAEGQDVDWARNPLTGCPAPAALALATAVGGAVSPAVSSAIPAAKMVEAREYDVDTVVLLLRGRPTSGRRDQPVTPP